MKAYPIKIGNTEYTVGGPGDVLGTPPSARGFSLRVFERGTGEYARVFKGTEENGYAFLIYADNDTKLILKGGQGADHKETVYNGSKELQNIRKEKYADLDDFVFMRHICLSGRAWLATLQNKKYYFVGIWNTTITSEQYTALKEYLAKFPKADTYVQMGELGSEASSKFAPVSDFSPKLSATKKPELSAKGKEFIRALHMKKALLPKAYADKLKDMSETKADMGFIMEAISLLNGWDKFAAKCQLHEEDYPDMVGITELMMFQRKATDEQKEQMEKCLTEENFDCVRNLITQATGMTTKHMREEDLKEGWRDLVAAGAISLSALAGGSLHAGKPAIHQPAPKSSEVSSLNQKTSEYIGRWEGKRNSVYKDSSGLPTIGIGHYLNGSPADRELFSKLFGDKVKYNDLLSGKQKLSNEQIDKLFDVDVKIKEKLASKKINNFSSLPLYVKNAIINGFYRGDLGPKTIKLMNSGDWKSATKQYLNHQNAKSGPTQIQQRMKTNALAFAQYSKNQSEYFGFNLTGQEIPFL